MVHRGFVGKQHLKPPDFVLGVDAQVQPGAHLGAAVSVGKGDGGTRGAAFSVDNDTDFVGLSLYGNRSIGNFNGKADIGWMHTKSDLSGNAFGMSVGDKVRADAWTVGFGAEYRVQTGVMDVVPHIGIR